MLCTHLLQPAPGPGWYCQQGSLLAGGPLHKQSTPEWPCYAVHHVPVQCMHPHSAPIQVLLPELCSLMACRIRDLNDEINKLIREKGHWERRIVQLGGPDYAKNAPKTTDAEGNEVSSPARPAAGHGGLHELHDTRACSADWGGQVLNTVAVKHLSLNLLLPLKWAVHKRSRGGGEGGQQGVER